MPEPFAPGDAAGAETLEIMAAAPRFNAWQHDVIAPFVGRRVLEVGSGIGNLSAHLLAREPEHLVLTDLDPWYREQLRRRFASRPNVRVDALRLPDPAARERFGGDRLDTVIALNVVEHIEQDVGALQSMAEMLEPGRPGRVVILVPAMEGLYGELDRELGHFRRYTRRSLTRALELAGLRAERMLWFNRAGVPGWWFNGRVRRAKRIPLDQLKAFDSLVPLLRLERFVPLPFGQSLIAVGTPA
jgi:SAM-dependent methyltransferase